MGEPVNENSENYCVFKFRIKLKQARNNKTKKMTKYRMGRDSDESRIGKGKAEMKGQFL